MRLLLTGAEGFTGRHLTKFAQAAGYAVFPLRADLTDPLAVAAEVAQIAPTYVVHLAAISAVTHVDEDAFYQVNLFGTLNLLKGLVDLPVVPLKVLLASSANVYGEIGGEPIDEGCCPRPVNHYAMSKLAMEYMAMTYSDRLPVVIARPFNYTGVGHDLRFVIPKIVDHFARKAAEIELGNLDVFREYNDVRGVCTTYLDLLNSGLAGETYNVCSGRAVSLRDVLGLMTEISGWHPEIKINPRFVRPNEIRTLCGSSKKLAHCVGHLAETETRSLLSWMYEAARDQSH